MNIQRLTPTLQNPYSQKSTKSLGQPSFTGLVPKTKLILNFEEKIARGLGKLVDTKAYEKLITNTINKPSLVDENKGLLFPHLIVLGSTMLSGFYVIKTLTNKQLDEKKKKTLAVNQSLVWAVSTILAYTLDVSVKKKFNIMLNKFKEVNKNMPKADLDALVIGFKMAKSMIAVDLVYRFIAPVAVTPLANAIGNRINDKKAANRVALDKQA